MPKRNNNYDFLYIENNIRDMFNKSIIKYSSLNYILSKNKKLKPVFKKNNLKKQTEFSFQSGDK